MSNTLKDQLQELMKNPDQLVDIPASKRQLSPPPAHIIDLKGEFVFRAK